MSSLFEQPVLAVTDPQTFAAVKGAIESSFSSGQVAKFLRSLERSKMRIRDFEGILNRGLLGKESIALYNALPVSDQGLTRERYLRLVEKVPADLRQRYLKAYAYY